MTVTSKYIELCIFARTNKGTRYLVLHRTKDVKIYPGIWQIITGNIEEGEKATDAALRELGEETGLAALAFWVVPQVNAFYNHTDDSINLISFFAAEVAADSIPTLSGEHDKWEWVDLHETQERLVWPGQKEGVRIVDEYILTEKPAGKLLRLK